MRAGFDRAAVSRGMKGKGGTREAALRGWETRRKNTHV